MEWVFFPLHPDTPDQGLRLEDLFKGRGLDLDAMHARMKGLMDTEALPYNSRSHTYNSRLAQELAKAFPQLHDALYRAYFVDGRNIGDPGTLIAIARDAGIPAEDAREVLTERTFQAEVDADWAKARQYGITGVPCFVVGGRGLVGAQPYETLVQFLKSMGAQPKAGA